MTKEVLIDKLKTYKIDKAKMEILKLKVEQFDREKQIEINNTIDDIHITTRMIDIAIKSLTEADKEFIKYKYHENMTIDDIAARKLIGTATVTRQNNLILNKILEIINVEVPS